MQRRRITVQDLAEIEALGLWDEWDERAAIKQYMGNMTQGEAELSAYDEIVQPARNSVTPSIDSI